MNADYKHPLPNPLPQGRRNYEQGGEDNHQRFLDSHFFLCQSISMSRDYAEKKVREALEQSGGNEARARGLLNQWVHGDHQLLIGLTGLHLNGIIPFWIARVREKEKVVKAAKPAQNQQTSKKKPKSFGEEMLRSFAGQGTAVFGLEGGAVPLRKKSASQKHIDAIKQIAREKDKY